MKREGKRVLSRTGARELTPQEAERISGSGPFQTIQTIGKNGMGDGDFRE